MLLLLLACQPHKADDSATDAMFDALTEAIAANGGYGGGVLRIETADGDVVEGARGQVTVGGDDMEVEETFEVASITKIFTATVVLQLVEEGALSLDDTLGERLPAWSEDLLVVEGEDLTAGVTVAQLLNHTSGLADFWNDPPYVSALGNAFIEDFYADPEHFWTPEEILPYVVDLDPYAAPGEGFHYSDTNYVLLGLLVEDLTGQALHEAMAARIIEPLGMAETWMSFREDRGLPSSHRYEEDSDMSEMTAWSADWASGGLISSTADLSLFLRGLLGGDLFDQASTLETMQTVVPTDWDPDVHYGLGLIRIDLDEDRALWGHDGYGGSFVYLDTADETLYSGTVNQTETDWWPVVAVGL